MTAKLLGGISLLAVLFFVVVAGLWYGILSVEARNITSYRDLLSDSKPAAQSNHTLSFVVGTDVAAGGYIEVIPPAEFTILATSTFAERNVELLVDGVPRIASSTLAPGIDLVEITTGSPGLIRYTLNPSVGLTADDALELRIGNHTSNSQQLTYIATTTGSTTATTTIPGDIEPIRNASTTGTHEVDVRIYDGGEVANAGFLIAIVDAVGVGPADTTEEVPPYRYNGAPTSTVGGTTLNVELSLETDELAICKFDTATGTAYASMPNQFTNTGLIFHSTIVPVTPNSVQRFYVRCLDDEGNFNIDDYEIVFTVNDIPTGTANEEGDVSGDGTGSGNTGTGSGDGGGGESGQASGEAPLLGGSSGGGGSGGGSGGSSGEDSVDEAGGGFETTDAPYRSGDGRVVISGYAFPSSRVTALVDGVVAQTANANGRGEYSITLDEIASGVYTFGVYATDNASVRSSTFSTSFTVTGALTTTLSNINVMPSVSVSPDPVNPGQPLTVSGYALPNAAITVENQKDRVSQSVKSFTTTSDSAGRWSVTIDTATFTTGTYQVRARAVQTPTISTSFSNYTYYGVGQEADVPLNADLNRDGRINLTDFSILLFWWGGDGGDSDPPADINRDSRVNLTDFSILLFNWTG